MEFRVPLLRQNEIGALDKIAAEFLQACEGKRKFAFYGEMGAGKTTFIKALCRYLDVVETATSPTYSIINAYSNGEPVYHLDLYRLESEREAVDAGVLECLDGSSYCFIEWPDRIDSYLDEQVVKVELSTTDEGERLLKLVD